MVVAITELDSLHFALFHVEQQTGWGWRWRIVGDFPPPYLKWREGTATGAALKFQPEVRGAPVEIMWQARPWEPFRQVALHRIKPHAVELEITATAPFILSAGTHSAISPVREHLARFFFKLADPVEITPATPLRVTGHADAPVPANVLLHPGEFIARQGVLTVRNVAISRDWSEPSKGEFVLTEFPGMKKRKLFATTTP